MVVVVGGGGGGAPRVFSRGHRLCIQQLFSSSGGGRPPFWFVVCSYRYIFFCIFLSVCERNRSGTLRGSSIHNNRHGVLFLLWVMDISWVLGLFPLGFLQWLLPRYSASVYVSNCLEILAIGTFSRVMKVQSLIFFNYFNRSLCDFYWRLFDSYSTWFA